LIVTFRDIIWAANANCTPLNDAEMIEKFPQIIFNVARLTMKEMLTMSILARWCEACLVIFVGLGKKIN
jgi:hypothetical protein